MNKGPSPRTRLHRRHGNERIMFFPTWRMLLHEQHRKSCSSTNSSGQKCSFVPSQVFMDSFHHLYQLLCIGLAGWVYNSKLCVHYSTFVFRNLIFNFSNSTLCINNFTSIFNTIHMQIFFYYTTTLFENDESQN